MIRKEDVYKIGVLGKPHGVRGEINFNFTDDSFDNEEVDFLLFLLDGILVPFFIEEYRFRSDDTAIIKLEGIDTNEQARAYSGTEIYLPLDHLEEDDSIPSWNFFVGFEVVDIHHGRLGTVAHVDDSTLNTLFVIEGPQGEILLPAHEAFITALDRKKRKLTVDIPDGLLE